MKLVKKLRDFHFFTLILIAAWNVFSLYATLLPNINCHIYLRELPASIFLFIYLIWIIAGVYLMYRFLEDDTKKDAFWKAFLWNFLLPIAEAIFSLVVSDRFYDFAGIWFGGLAECLFAIFTIILAVIGGIIFLIGSFISRNRIRKEREKGRISILIGDVLNVLAALGLSLLLFTLGIAFLYEKMTDIKEEKELRAKENFQTWVYDTYTEDEVKDLQYDGFEYAAAVQLLSEGLLAPEELDEEFTPKEKSILLNAVESYKTFAKPMGDSAKIELINSVLSFDHHDRTISGFYEVTGIGRNTGFSCSFWCEIIFTDQLELKDIQFTDAIPVEIR